MTPVGRPARLIGLWLFWLWLILAVTTFALAYWGWYDQAERFQAQGWRAHENAAFMALRAFGFSAAYGEPKLVGSDWRLIVSRWTGLVVFTATVVAAGLELSRAQIAAMLAASRRRHVLIVGDHEMATALAAEAARRGQRTVHLSATCTKAHKVGPLITLPRPPADEPLAVGRASVARRVIVAETDLGASIELALRVLEEDPQAAPVTDKPKVAVHLHDPVTAERIHHLPGGLDLFAFSEAQVCARAVLFRHPPFLLARRIGAPAAHILIIGFGRLGQAIASDVAVNSMVSDLDTPLITVIDRTAAAAERDFLSKHPEFRNACGLRVVEGLEEMRRLDEGAGGSWPPVCVAYVCLKDTADALARSAILCEWSSQYEEIQGPIFVRIRSGGPRPPRGGLIDLAPRKIYSFGAVKDLAAFSRALDEDPDLDARGVHEAYAELAGRSAQPWESLPEALRVSNRRVISHVPAKLASLGFDLDPWLRMTDSERPWPPRLAAGEPLRRDRSSDARDAAALEHRRWMAERFVNGWRQGAYMDPVRKIHVDLVPFEQLSDSVKAFDAGVIDWLERFVTEPVGQTRASVAGALHRPGPTDATLSSQGREAAEAMEPSVPGSASRSLRRTGIGSGV